MSQTAAKRKRDKLDEDGPEKKKAKVSELPILSALDAKQKAAIFAAYQTQNDTLFEISCGTFSIDVSETKQELIQHTKITLSNTYLNLRFSVKKKFKENANWKRDLDLRCDDMLTVEALLTSIEEDVRLNIAKIENRMINILGIASYDENDKKMALKLKITQRGFGQYKPTASFMEYSIVLSTMKKYEEEIKGLIDELSDIDASALIGNDTKAKRAKLALKRREKNADTVRLNRAKKKNELSNRNDANELSGDEQLQDDQKRSELDHDSFIDIEIESRLNQL
eukprot:769058_1